VTPPVPQLSDLAVTPSKFKPASHGPTIAPSSAAGTTISYRDTLPATTRFQVLQCTAKHGRCTSLRAVGAFTQRDHRGANRLRFTGRVGGHAPAAGHYLLRAIATLNGQHSKPISVPFTSL
jgi:hypothetical protein